MRNIEEDSVGQYDGDVRKGLIDRARVMEL